MKRKDYYMPSKDGIHRLHVVLWEPDTAVKAVVQISHVMVEMIDRYEDFARFLNQQVRLLFKSLWFPLICKPNAVPLKPL